MLSFIYRLLARARKRDEVTMDMIGTCEEARAEAQSRGRWSYLIFAVREISGLLGPPHSPRCGNTCRQRMARSCSTNFISPNTWVKRWIECGAARTRRC